MGGRPVATKFADLNSSSEYGDHWLLNLPSLLQQQAAAELLDYRRAATEYLFNFCYSGPVQNELLKTIDAHGAVKYGRRSFISWESGVKEINVGSHDNYRVD